MKATADYSILKAWVDNISFESPIPNLFFGITSTNSNLNTSIDIQIKVADTEEGRLYQVSLVLKVSPAIDEVTTIFDLLVTYSALVHINDEEELTAEDIYDILRYQVSQSIYATVRSIVWNVTRELGFPPVLLQNIDLASLEEKYSDITEEMMSYEEEIDKYNTSDKDICYANVIKYLLTNPCKELTIDLDAVKSYFDPAHAYMPLPSYLYLHRFLTPIQYNHPTFEDCDNHIWPMLFQFMFGSSLTTCRIVPNDNGLPELAFIFNNQPEKLVSDVDYVELKALLTFLVYEAITSISLHLICCVEKPHNSSYAKELERQIMFNEYAGLFSDNLAEGTIEFDIVNMYYSKINDCFRQTLIYKTDNIAEIQLP